MTMATNDVPQLLTVDQLAERLGVSTNWVYKQTSKAAYAPLPAVRVGRHLRFDPAAINHWLESRGAQIAPETWTIR